MEHPEVDDKQSQMQRVLDRVRQLPILPGITVDPELLRDIDFGQQQRSGAHDRAISSRPRIAGEQDGPAVRPLLLILTTATSTIALAMIATVMTLDVMRREPSPRVRPAGADQAAIALRAPERPNISIEESQASGVPLFQRALPEPMAVDPKNGSINALPSPEPSIPAPETTRPQALPQEREHAVPQAEPSARKREDGKHGAPAASGERKPGQKPAIRTAVEQSGRTHGVEPQLRRRAVGIGDVLSGGL